MSYNGGNVQKPVSTSDVAMALGTTQQDVGQLCAHMNINKWAWYKPVSYAKIGVLTETERQSIHYGLTPYLNTRVLSLLRSDVSHTDIATEFANAKNYLNEWTYTKPTGGSTSVFRLTDFVESPNAGEGRGSNGATTNFGYQPNTPPPLIFGSEWSIGKTSLDDVANNKIVETGTGSSNGAWYARPYTNTGTGSIGSGSAVKGTYCYEGLQYQDYSARFGAASNQNINMNNSSVIPINYIFSGTITNENWRLGLVVKVPGISGNNVIPSTVVDVFFSQYPLSSINSDIASNILKFSIDMCTNQTLAYKMLTYVNAKGTTTFECFPVFALINMATVYGGGTTQRTYQLINGTNASFYSLPMGNKDFSITVDAEVQPAPSGNAQKTVGKWTIMSVGTGLYTGNSSTPTSQRYPINNIIVYWSGSGSPTASTTYNVNTSFLWQTYDGAVRRGYYENPNIGIKGSDTIVLPNNSEYNGKYGKILYGGPNLVMPDENQITLTVTTT